MPSNQVLSAYRTLLRATRIAFDKDLRMLTSARAQAAEQMRAGRVEFANPTPEVLQERLVFLNDVATMLRSNIVQGERIATEEEAAGEAVATVSTKHDAELTNQERATYKLRIHEHTELGDNESLRVKPGKTNLAGTARRIVRKSCGAPQ
ncbi:uncharacterized protein V1510DRAFT_429549 [Dipodascopsis tothii]|uniref:uncharacterized protein n=1 Tax=Dipodascopsis tothii TaxID=44089 RepID=UPI0034CD6AD9